MDAAEVEIGHLQGKREFVVSARLAVAKRSSGESPLEQEGLNV